MAGGAEKSCSEDRVQTSVVWGALQLYGPTTLSVWWNVVERGRLRSGYVGACLGRRPKVDVPQTDVMMMNHYLSDPHNVIYKNLDI